MPKIVRSCRVDEEVDKKLKKLKINVSGAINNFLKKLVDAEVCGDCGQALKKAR